MTWIPASVARHMPGRCWAGRNGYEADGIVIHHTVGGDGRATANWSVSQDHKSWHFTVFRDGRAAQHVSIDRAAQHAGGSEWTYRGESDYHVNAYTIGIELANWGRLFRRDGQWYGECGGTLVLYGGPTPIGATLQYQNGHEVMAFWEPYPAAQIDGLKRLIAELDGRGIPPRLVGHEEIHMPYGSGRKTDPGPLFPWHEFNREPRTRSVIHGPHD